MNPEPLPFYVLIVAAGQGLRCGGDMPKQYRRLAGKAVLQRSVEAFLALPGLAGLKVVISEGHENYYHDAVANLDLGAPVYGGEGRVDSVFNGLLSFSDLKDSDVVLIHDAARPFVDPVHILETVRQAHRTGAACLGCRVADTLRRNDGIYFEREGLWSVQTPQGFHYGLVRRAHEARSARVFTDDTGLVASLGHDIAMVEGSGSNFKITTAEDWAMAERMMQQAYETRTGTGFDVHAFADEEAKTIRLCGIDIAHGQRLEGHSDADVGLHALTDALLGALALGDIGQHFPPSDPQWKGAASDRFLKHAVDLVTAKGGRIVNLDLTIICEAPKIGPHRAVMQDCIAAICGIEPDRVSVKATTTERLGFTGRGEGIAAQGIATISVPHG